MFTPLYRIVALVLICMPAAAQDLQWYASLHSPNLVNLDDLQTDSSDHIYAFGRFSGVCDFDFGPEEYWLNSGTSRALYVQKLNHDGTLVWAIKLDSNIDTFGIEQDIDRAGNSYVLGRFSGVVDFDPGPGVYNLDAGIGNIQPFAMKLDPDGNLLWAKQFDLGNIFWNEPAADDFGNIWLCTGFSGTVDVDPGPDAVFLSAVPFISNTALIKLDTAGNLLWAAALNRMNAVSAATDMYGNFYLRGSFYGTMDADPGPGIYSLTATSQGGQTLDHVNIKLDPFGNFLWAKNTARSTTTYSVLFFGGMEVDAHGQIYMSTQLVGAYDFDPGPGVRILTSHANDIVVMKLDSLGNLAWIDQLDASLETVLDLKLDADANCYVTGYITDDIDMDPGPGVVISPNNRGGSYDCYILKLDSEGNFGWVTRFGGEGGEIGYYIAVDEHSRVTVGGQFSGIMDFGDMPGDEFLTPYIGDVGSSFLAQVAQDAKYNGAVYEDLNNNQLQDPGEPGFPNIVLEASGTRRYTSTNPAGKYRFTADISGDTLRIASPRPYWTVAPDFALPDTSHLTNDFVIATPANVQDVSISVASDAFRPGFNTDMRIHIRNLGTASIDTLRIAVDSFFINPSLLPLVLNPNPQLETPEHLEWQMYDLAPGAVTVIQLILRTPVTTTVGTPINIPVTASLTSDPDITNNSARVQTTVMASLDPNDKRVYPETIPVTQLAETRLQYLIRFQNTGTLPADFVILRDTLPATVDLASLEIMGASHSYTWRLRDAGILEIRFDGINLPDSSSNPEASQGFAAFSLRPLPTLEVGDSVINSAGIYFDYNQPVITRAAISVLTETSSVKSVSEKKDFPFVVAPNPATPQTAVQLKWQKNEKPGSVNVIDLRGLVIQRHGFTGDAEGGLLRPLPKGLYAVELRIGDQSATRLLLVD